MNPPTITKKIPITWMNVGVTTRPAAAPNALVCEARSTRAIRVPKTVKARPAITPKAPNRSDWIMRPSVPTSWHARLMGWMRQLPTWVAGIVMAVLFAAAWFGITFVTTPELGLGARVLVSVSVGAFYGIGMGFWLGRTRRGYGSAARRPEFGRAVRRGVVPPDVDVDEWRRALTNHQRQYRPLRWAAPLLYLPMTALAVWLAITGQPLFWFGAAVFVAVFVITVATTPRTLRNTDSMLAELDRRAGVPQESGS